MSDELKGFEKVCKVSKLNENEGQHFKVNEIDVALFKVDDKVYALNNICPHQHANIMHDGFIENGTVICPAHGWGFNLCNGKMQDAGAKLDSYEVKIVDEFVYVKVFGKKFNWNF
ncbi:MAG: nitrite reductase small subunit NirD [Bacteroidetes bacterium]|nr:nitrite reductase small subunit NirD [Bacteroidota bacterium]MBU1116149.1 nitrite reductase small subunit NirD [Bacteroidota bacterium]MBU1800441.1 nitrite reductase small subunit NirD [Bacteroidota bacterium]